MSKKKNKDASKTPPIDFQLETKNLQYTVVLKDNEIEMLKNDNLNKKSYINELQTEMDEIKKDCIHSYELDAALKELRRKNESLEIENRNLKSRINEMETKFEEEKKQMRQTYDSEINHLRLTIVSYTQKAELNAQLLNEKQKLNEKIEELEKEKEDIIKKGEEALREHTVKNEIKFTNLKKKMNDNIQQTRDKVTELNMQYIDVSTKLTLLQNHRLLIELEYQTQQLDELKNKNSILERKVFELTKDIEIHKGVEIALAEKKAENSSSKVKSKSQRKVQNNSCFNSTASNNMTKNSKLKINDEDKTIENSSSYYNRLSTFNENNIEFKNNSKFYNTLMGKNIDNKQLRIINLEKKIIKLENKLNSNLKDYNSLKDKNEYVEDMLKNYEQKYLGLFNFLEDCLNQFFNDEEIKNNKELYVNIDSIQKFDFSVLNKNEKYSTLIILMKYLMPLLNNKNNIESTWYKTLNNISLKIHKTNNSHSSRKLFMSTSRVNNSNKSRNLLINSKEKNFSKSKNLFLNNPDLLPSIKIISLKPNKSNVNSYLNKKILKINP